MGGRDSTCRLPATPPRPRGRSRPVIAEQIMALPTFAPGVGPFPERRAAGTPIQPSLSPGEKNAAASLYLALVTAECPQRRRVRPHHHGRPVCRQPPFLRGARGNRRHRSLRRASTGTTLGGGPARDARRVADKRRTKTHSAHMKVAPLAMRALLAGYVEAWRRAAALDRRALSCQRDAMAKFLSLREAVADHFRDGDTSPWRVYASHSLRGRA